jgi:transposase
VHVAVVDGLGRPLGDCEVLTTWSGYQQALAFAAGYGTLARAGVEGTGCYGAGLTQYLTGQGVPVVEVNRPDRATRRRSGKSDPIDAYAAARAAAAGTATVAAKARSGIVEAIRVLHVVRRSAVKARTKTINQLKTLLVSGPTELREQLRELPVAALIEGCAGLQPVSLRPAAAASSMRASKPTRAAAPADPTAATMLALRRLARRYQHLTEEITDADRDLDQLTAQAAPALREQLGVGPDSATKLLIAAGDNPDRMRSEAAFAHLCAAAPIPASSGQTIRHRLNRGGDRQANNALHTIALTRLRHSERTRHYAAERAKKARSDKDTLRCLKRYIVRELFPILKADLAKLATANQDQQRET